MTDESFTAFRGRSSLPSGSRVRTRKADGRCSVCDKKLSAYNDNDTCWTHTARKKRRVRGTPK